MPKVELDDLNVILLEDILWIVAANIAVPRYDFAFEKLFACRHPIYLPEQIQAVGRFGVTDDYRDLYSSLKAKGISLIHTPDKHRLASELICWYPFLKDITPRSVWFDTPPEAGEIEKHFSYPVFIKGSRQTNKHKADLSIVTPGPTTILWFHNIVTIRSYIGSRLFAAILSSYDLSLFAIRPIKFLLRLNSARFGGGANALAAAFIGRNLLCIPGQTQRSLRLWR
jgi:hypothetical protein